MKITFITPSFPYPRRGDFTGIERIVENLAISLKKLNNEIKIVTTFWNGGKKFDYYKGISILRVLDSKKFLGKIGSIFYINILTFGLNVIKKKNYKFYKDSDVIILPFIFGFSRFLKIKKKIVISIFYHVQRYESFYDYFHLPFYYFIARKQFNSHKNIVAISNNSRNELIKYLGLKKEYIRVIPTGVNVIKFNPKNKSEEIRKKYGKNIILFSGFIVHRKKVPVLLKAMTYIIKEIPDVQLIILGKGPLWNFCLDLSKTLGIQNNTTFLGFVSDRELSKYYASSDLYILPSELEGFGQVILESMASGTPVICSNKPPMSEIIENGGITFNLNDPKDLAEKIINLLNNKEEIGRLKEKSLKIVKKYDYVHIAKLYIDFIKDIKKSKV